MVLMNIGEILLSVVMYAFSNVTLSHQHAEERDKIIITGCSRVIVRFAVKVTFLTSKDSLQSMKGSCIIPETLLKSTTKFSIVKETELKRQL